MWMTAVCCTRRASICAARDDPLRDFIPAAPCTRSRGISLSAGASGAAKGKGSALGDEGSRFPRRAASLRGMLSTTPLRPTGKRQDKSGPLTATGLSLWRSRELAEKDCGRKWPTPPFARMVGRDFAYVNAFVITLSFLVGPQPTKSPCTNCFLADCAAESDSLHV